MNIFLNISSFLKSNILTSNTKLHNFPWTEKIVKLDLYCFTPLACI